MVPSQVAERQGAGGRSEGRAEARRVVTSSDAREVPLQPPCSPPQHQHEAGGVRGGRGRGRWGRSSRRGRGGAVPAGTEPSPLTVTTDAQGGRGGGRGASDPTARGRGRGRGGIGGRGRGGAPPREGNQQEGDGEWNEGSSNIEVERRQVDVGRKGKGAKGRQEKVGEGRKQHVSVEDAPTCVVCCEPMKVLRFPFSPLTP